MRALFLFLLCAALPAVGQPLEHGPIPIGTAFFGLPMKDPHAFTHAVERGNIKAIDRWMKREVYARRNFPTKPILGDTVIYPIYATWLCFESMVDWLKKQPGVVDAAWDGCMDKATIWPGNSSIGLRVLLNGVECERCYRVQEGRLGTINIFGWRPKVRKTREQLKYLGAAECAGFVAEQRRICEERGR